MPPPVSRNIRGIIFDLDGTLYVCDPFADTIHDAAVAYIAGLRGIRQAEACQLMADTRSRLLEERGTHQTLSSICCELGGTIKDLHQYFCDNLHPEAYLVRDERVVSLLLRLSQHFQLYIFTNNNRTLATRIMDLLGVGGLFRGIFAIDDAWLAKPDEGALLRVLDNTGLAPSEALFVGDRYDVDLRLPEQLGCPVYLSQSVDQLLRLEELLFR